MMESSNYTMVITGLGGQGIIRFIQILGSALMDKGYSVNTSETHGLSQREGKVKCFLRYGNKLLAPIPINGSANMIITLEKSCILDVLNFAKLDKSTDLILAEFKKPLKNQKYISDDYFKQILPNFSKNIHYITITEIKNDIRLLNTLILGYIISFFPLSYQDLQKSLNNYLSGEILEINLKVLQIGSIMNGKKD